MRTFAQIKRYIETAQTADPAPTGPLAERVCAAIAADLRASRGEAAAPEEPV